ncbi:hypothetical protein WR25_02351 [Diploscapter pachys]|uniref:Uncharacterized protein n=1 Tax=Diploscapter pachys TaxID=2018661 RepID=A0A2A2JZL6_9BILA|nr:hypothetical protein WR25_02351 [Diploscapter pachys]
MTDKDDYKPRSASRLATLSVAVRKSAYATRAIPWQPSPQPVRASASAKPNDGRNHYVEMPDLSNIDLTQLPHSLQALIECIGLDSAYRLTHAFGGRPKYIPKHRRRTKLADVLPPEALDALIQRFAGLALEIPKSDHFQRQLRNQQIQRESASGLSRSLLADNGAEEALDQFVAIDRLKIRHGSSRCNSDLGLLFAFLERCAPQHQLKRRGDLDTVVGKWNGQQVLGAFQAPQQDKLPGRPGVLCHQRHHPHLIDTGHRRRARQAPHQPLGGQGFQVGATETVEPRRRGAQCRTNAWVLTNHALQRIERTNVCFGRLAPHQKGLVLLRKAVAQAPGELLGVDIAAVEQATDQAAFVDVLIMSLGVLFLEDDPGDHSHVAVDELRDRARGDVQ